MKYHGQIWMFAAHRCHVFIRLSLIIQVRLIVTYFRINGLNRLLLIQPEIKQNIKNSVHLSTWARILFSLFPYKKQAIQGFGTYMVANGPKGAEDQENSKNYNRIVY